MFDNLDSSDIALVAAVLSPVIVVIINTANQYAKDRSDFYLKHECEVVETYLKSLGRYIYDNDKQENASAYGTAHAEIYMYIPENLWYKIDNMDILLAQLKNTTFSTYPDKLSECRVMYEELCKTLSPLSRHPNRLIRFLRKKKLSRNIAKDLKRNADNKDL